MLAGFKRTKTMPIVVTVKTKVQWQAAQISGSKRWMGICDALNLSMEADSLDELHEVIEEAIQLLMRDLLADNELDAYLRQRGWSVSNVPTSNQKDVEFDVPWELVAPRGEHGHARIAH